jgi:hypothetical protein
MTGTGAFGQTERPHVQWPKTAVRVGFGTI